MTSFDREYKCFNAKEYVKLSFAEGSPKERFLEFMQAELEKKHDRNNGKLLELGTGPAIYTSLLASKYYNDIILSEYAELNREELMKWVKQEDGALDWSHYVSLISKLEHSDPKHIEKRTRKAIKEVLPCDLTKDTPVPPYTCECFDCIVTSGTLECCFIDIESYEMGLMKVFDLLVPGGLLILYTAFGHSSYEVDGTTYPVLNLNEKNFEDALKKAGFLAIQITSEKDTFSVKYNISGDKLKRYIGFVKAIKPVK